jgi:hypothetical protein
MTTATTYALVRVGYTAQLVTIEAEVSDGLPATVLVGLPEFALREARDRIRASIVNSGEKWPQNKISISLAPARLSSCSSSLDLAIAVAILAAAGNVPCDALEGVLFVAELGLDGRLRPTPDIAVLLTAIASAELPPAAKDGTRTIVVPLQDIRAATEAAELIPASKLRAIGTASLGNVAFWLRGGASCGRNAGMNSGSEAGLSGDSGVCLVPSPYPPNSTWGIRLRVTVASQRVCQTTRASRAPDTHCPTRDALHLSLITHPKWSTHGPEDSDPVHR